MEDTIKKTYRGPWGKSMTIKTAAEWALEYHDRDKRYTRPLSEVISAAMAQARTEALEECKEQIRLVLGTGAALAVMDYFKHKDKHE